MLDTTHQTYLVVKEPCDCTPGGTLASSVSNNYSERTRRSSSWPLLGAVASAILLLVAGWNLKSSHENSQLAKLQKENQQLKNQVVRVIDCVDSLR